MNTVDGSWIIEGELRGNETDGGFLPMSWTVGDEDVGCFIRGVVGANPRTDRGYNLASETFPERGSPAVHVRVTVELLDVEEEMDRAASQFFDPSKPDQAKKPDFVETMDDKWGTCRSCGEPVAWSTTKRGKKMPLSAKEVDGKYVSHFSDCPNADQHRGKR